MPRTLQCFCKHIKFNPTVSFFKPQGIPLTNLKTIELSLEEIESYRLRYIENLDQRQAAQKLSTSTSTYQRLLYSACQKIAEALTTGKALKIIKHD